VIASSCLNDKWMDFIMQSIEIVSMINRYDYTLQIFALHTWVLCYYDNVYKKLLIMVILFGCFLLPEWKMAGFYHAINWDSVYGFLTLSFFALTATICLLSIYWLDVSVWEIWWKLCLIHSLIVSTHSLAMIFWMSLTS
jgi:hypothetical protein